MNDELYLRVAGYLAALDAGACERYCEIREVSRTGVTPCAFETPEEVQQCMADFIAEGIDLRYLFDNGTVWGIYLRALAPEKYHDGINLMLMAGTPADIMYYFRSCYRFGFPALEDATFDALEKLYAQYYPELSFLMEQTYDDDQYGSLVADAVKMSNVRITKRTGGTRGKVSGDKVYDELNTDKSTSIRPVIDPQEAFDFWRNSPVCRVHFSLKIDGVNTKMQFSEKEDEGLVLALSRGRSADSLDYTQAVQNMIRVKEIDAKKLSGRITGESFVGLNELPELQQRYADKEYKTPKSTAMAMLRAADKFNEDDYRYLNFCAFSIEGMKPDKAFELLQSSGMSVPPYIIVEGEEIPRTSLEEFNAWMTEHVLDPLYEQGQSLGIGSDGVVMYLLADINTERADKYSDSNIAIKYSHWTAATYVSEVEEIIFEQRRVEASIVLRIAPVVMRDSNVATRVGVGSPDILISDGIRIGDRIEFARKSEAYNVYLKKCT